MTKIKLSREKAVEEIVIDLQKGVDKKDILSRLVVLCQKDKRTIERYYNIAYESYCKTQEKANKAAEQEYISETVKAVKNGLKTKSERLMILQNQVDACLSELDELNEIEKTGVIYEKVALRQTIKQLQAEISKIEGDYAPKKQEVKIDNSGVDFFSVEE